MSKVITLTATNGETIQFVDEIKAQGGMKDVMFSPNKDYVIAFFREPADLATKERLEMITGTYREKIFNQEGANILKIILLAYRRSGISRKTWCGEPFLS